MFGDGSHILYVNGKYRGDDEVGKLMHDFSCTDPDDMNYEILAKKARYFKQDEKGRKRSGGPLLCTDRNEVEMEAMCKAMEDMRNETELRKAREIASKLITKGKLSCEEIADATGLFIEEVIHLAESESV